MNVQQYRSASTELRLTVRNVFMFGFGKVFCESPSGGQDDWRW